MTVSLSSGISQQNGSHSKYSDKKCLMQTYEFAELLENLGVRMEGVDAGVG